MQQQTLMQQYGLVRGLRTRLFGPPKPKALRPTGHSAVIERLRSPVIVLTSMAMALGACYVLAHSLAEAFIRAWQIHDLANAIPSSIALFAVFVTSFVLDFTFITACLRFGMHVRRGEGVWAVIALVAALFTGGVEVSTMAYLYATIEPTSVSGSAAQIVASIPAALFWVRAGAALLCVGYLVIGVLPPIIQPGDFNRAAAAKAGGAALALIDDLTNLHMHPDPHVKIAMLGAMLELFQHSTKPVRAGEAANYRPLITALSELHTVASSPAPAAPALPASAPTRRERVQTYAEAYPDENDDSDFTKTNAVLEAVGVLKGGQGNGHQPNPNTSMHDDLADESGLSWRSQPANMTGNIATRSVALPVVGKPHIGGRVTMHGHAPSKAYVNANNSTARMRKPLRRESRPKIARVMALEPTLSVNQLAKAAGIDLSVASRRHPLKDIETAEMINARRRRLGLPRYDFDPVAEIEEELPTVDDDDTEDQEDEDSEELVDEDEEDAQETTDEEVVNA